MCITTEDRFWHLFCISETLREEKITYDLSIEAIYNQIPYGIAAHAALIGNASPVCYWVMENILGYELDHEQEKWVKK